MKELFSVVVSFAVSVLWNLLASLQALGKPETFRLEDLLDDGVARDYRGYAVTDDGDCCLCGTREDEHEPDDHADEVEAARRRVFP